jgi:hypothetical protein
MSIRSSILRSKDDFKPLSSKSYYGLNICISTLNVENFIDEDREEDVRKRIYEREFDVDHVKKIFRITTEGSSSMTVNQIRDFFDDIGFNGDVSFSDVHGSDIMLAYNIGGFLIPFYKNIIDFLFKKSCYKNLLLTKLSPGKKRLHCRIYHGSKGEWYLTAHVDDANWLNFFQPFKLVKSHFTKGSGDYDTGTEIMERGFKSVLEKYGDNEILFTNLDKIYHELENSLLKGIE